MGWGGVGWGGECGGEYRTIHIRGVWLTIAPTYQHRFLPAWHPAGVGVACGCGGRGGIRELDALADLIGERGAFPAR